MKSSLRHRYRVPRRTLGAIVITTLVTAGAAGASSTAHRMNVTQTSGSEGATTFLQTTNSGSAIQGEVASSANASLKLPFGVLGEFNPSDSTFGVGVAGISTTGYAVGAEAFGGSPAMIALAESNGSAIVAYNATNSNSPTIEGVSQGTGYGVEGMNTSTGIAGLFQGSRSNGVVAISNGFYAPDSTNSLGELLPVAAVVGEQTNGGPGALFDSSSGIGAIGVGSSVGPGLFAVNPDHSSDVLSYNSQGLIASGTSGDSRAVIEAIDDVGGSRLFQTTSYNGGNFTPSFIISDSSYNRSHDSSLTYSSDVQTSGDVYVYGKIYENCASFPMAANTSCQPVSADPSTTGTAKTRGGADVAMYGTRESLPTVEDEGSAQLQGGRAYVRLDNAFAATMAMDRPYRVYITPSGNTNGVFVANRTPQGFEVVENNNGRSSVGFDYRIVAAPYGDRSARLALVPQKVATPVQHTAAETASRKKIRALTSGDFASGNAAFLKALANHPKPHEPASFATLPHAR